MEHEAQSENEIGVAKLGQKPLVQAMRFIEIVS